MNELKPCPFCGNKKPVLMTRRGQDGWRDYLYVLCNYNEGGCGASGQWSHYATEAVQAWNTREGWISVKDRLPDKSGKYLTITDTNVIETMHYSAKYKLFNHFDELKPDGKEIKTITHWMPLPEPPGGES